MRKTKERKRRSGEERKPREWNKSLRFKSQRFDLFLTTDHKLKIVTSSNMTKTSRRRRKLVTIEIKKKRRERRKKEENEKKKKHDDDRKTFRGGLTTLVLLSLTFLSPLLSYFLSFSICFLFLFLSLPLFYHISWMIQAVYRLLHSQKHVFMSVKWTIRNQDCNHQTYILS